jgi:hypothetical protein
MLFHLVHHQLEKKVFGQCSGSEKTNCREKKDKDDAELQLFLQEVENEKEMNNDEIAYDSDNSIEIEF